MTARQRSPEERTNESLIRCQHTAEAQPADRPAADHTARTTASPRKPPCSTCITAEQVHLAVGEARRHHEHGPRDGVHRHRRHVGGQLQLGRGQGDAVGGARGRRRCAGLSCADGPAPEPPGVVPVAAGDREQHAGRLDAPWRRWRCGRAGKVRMLGCIMSMGCIGWQGAAAVRVTRPCAGGFHGAPVPSRLPGGPAHRAPEISQTEGPQ